MKLHWTEKHFTKHAKLHKSVMSIFAYIKMAAYRHNLQFIHELSDKFGVERGDFMGLAKLIKEYQNEKTNQKGNK